MSNPLEKFVKELPENIVENLPMVIEDFAETYRIAQLFNISIEEARECR